VCFGSFCDVMRCDILLSTAVFADDFVSTDLSIWAPPLGDFQGDTKKTNLQPVPDWKSKNHSEQPKSEVRLDNQIGNDEEEGCDEDYFFNLRQKCVGLIWECLQGLISILDAQDFRVIQGIIPATQCLSCVKLCKGIFLVLASWK